MFALTRARQERKKNGDQAFGRSRGGFSSKLHLTVDALGNAVRFILTGGQRHDWTQAAALIIGFLVKAVIGDKAFDNDELLQLIEEEMQAQAVIPSRANRTEQRAH